jgi:hypothetical protein
MLYTSINVSFLDSCIQSFSESFLYESAYEPFLPVTYETSTYITSSDSAIGRYKAPGSNFASYTGFIASFYQDGQLKIFGYAISGKINNYPISGIISYFVFVSHGQKTGDSSYLASPHHSFGKRYQNGESIHSPYIWGDEDVITTMDFSEWVRQEIYYVIQSGIFLMQRRNIL